MTRLRVTNPPAVRPLLVYDGDCAFCRFWLLRLRRAVGSRADYAPSQHVAARFSDIPPERFRRAVQLIVPDGRVFEGAEAVFRLRALAPGHGGWIWAYRHLPGARPAFELGYRWVAGHRPLLYRVTRSLLGPAPPAGPGGELGSTGDESDARSPAGGDLRHLAGRRRRRWLASAAGVGGAALLVLAAAGVLRRRFNRRSSERG